MTSRNDDSDDVRQGIQKHDSDDAASHVKRLYRDSEL